MFHVYNYNWKPQYPGRDWVKSANARQGHATPEAARAEAERWARIWPGRQWGYGTSKRWDSVTPL
jgi:hypothetical protein